MLSDACINFFLIEIKKPHDKESPCRKLHLIAIGSQRSFPILKLLLLLLIVSLHSQISSTTLPKADLLTYRQFHFSFKIGDKLIYVDAFLTGFQKENICSKVASDLAKLIRSNSFAGQTISKQIRFLRIVQFRALFYSWIGQNTLKFKLSVRHCAQEGLQCSNRQWNQSRKKAFTMLERCGCCTNFIWMAQLVSKRPYSLCDASFI